MYKDAISSEEEKREFLCCIVARRNFSWAACTNQRREERYEEQDRPTELAEERREHHAGRGVLLRRVYSIPLPRQQSVRACVLDHLIHSAVGLVSQSGSCASRMEKKWGGNCFPDFVLPSFPFT